MHRYKSISLTLTLLSFLSSLLSHACAKKQKHSQMFQSTPKKTPHKKKKASLHKVYFLDETRGYTHAGVKGYECPQRLKSHDPAQKFSEFLRGKLLPLTPNIQGVFSRRMSHSQMDALVTELSQKLPDCPIEGLFELLKLPQITPKKKTLFHETDRAKEAPIKKGTLEALLANAALIKTVVSRLDETPMEAQKNFLLIRPPGHHACGSLGGFCYINNLIWAQRLILAKDKTKKIAIIDLDMHDGNGTRSLLSQVNHNTKMLNLFNKDIYPFGPSNPYNTLLPTPPYLINKPLAKGTSHLRYDATLKQGLRELKALFPTREEPDIVLISAGFDTSRIDSETRFSNHGFLLEEEDYEGYYKKITEAFPNSHIIAFLEGGYDPRTLQSSFVSAMKGLFRH